MLDNIWNAISSIPDKIKELVTSVNDFFSNFWEGFKQGFSDTLDGIGKFFDNLGTNLGNWFTDVGNWFSDLGSSIGQFFSDLWTNLSGSLGDIFKVIGDIFSWIGNFFSALLDFVYHIFIPTDEQWNNIKEDYRDLGTTFNNHIPFVGLFSDELEKAKQVVYNEDFLNIKFDSWSFNLGVIKYSTPEIQFDKVVKAYEPYRMTVRSFLTLILYALIVVYIIKYALNYGHTEGNSQVIDGQTSFFDKGGDSK